MGRAAGRKARRGTEGTGEPAYLARYGGLGVGARAGVSGAGLGGVAALRGAVDSPRRARPAARAEALVRREGRRCRVAGGAPPGVGGAARTCAYVEDGIRLLYAQYPLQGNRREAAGRLSAKSNRRCRVTGGRKQGGSRPSPHAVAG